MNWNVIFAHSWPDALYDATLLFLRDNTLDANLPVHINRTFRRRAQSGYSVRNDQIVLQAVPPWNSSSTTFVVVKASQRDDVLTRMMHDMRSVGTNAHMLADRVHREGFLGISRRYIHTFLKTHPSVAAMRVTREDTTKAIVKSFRPEYPFQHWQMDLMDFQKFARQNSGYKYVFVAIDIFTKFVYIAPIKDKSQKHVAQVLNKIFLSGDIPDILHSDNGTEFKGNNGYVERLCREFKVKQIFGDAYSPQTQGFVENKNKQIKTLINYYRVNNNTSRFVDMLDQMAYTINNSKHSVTGFTPMELHRGRRTAKNYTLFENVTEMVLEEIPDADLENWYNTSSRNYMERVRETKRKLRAVANKREQREQQRTPELKAGYFVQVLTYVSHGSDAIQGTFIRVGEGMYPQNPLRVREAGVFRDLTSMAKLPRTLFSQFELKGPRKIYKFVFRIESVVQKQNSIPKYTLHYENEAVWLKADTMGRYTREFTRAHLVLFSEKPDANKVPIRPNPLYVDLTILKEPVVVVPTNAPLIEPTAPLIEPNAPVVLHEEDITTCSIQSLLKNKKFLQKEYIFLVIPDRTNSGNVTELAVYVAQLLDYSVHTRAWRVKMENDRDDPTDPVTYNTSQTVRLLPELYNRMGTDSGWRFVKHNKLLVLSKPRFCVRAKEHFALATADTPLTERINDPRLVDPSADIQTLMNTGRGARVRYADNTYTGNGPIGVPRVRTGIQIKGVFNKEIQLIPYNYGKLHEINGWEFEDFNQVFNNFLQNIKV